MKRKWFILRELIFPFCVTLTCVITTLVCHYLERGFGTGAFGIFGVFSIRIWVVHLSYAVKHENYYQYLKERKDRKDKDRLYMDKIKNEYIKP